MLSPEMAGPTLQTERPRVAGRSQLRATKDERPATSQAGVISKLVKKMYCEAADIKGVPVEKAEQEISEIAKQVTGHQARVSTAQLQQSIEESGRIEIAPEELETTPVESLRADDEPTAAIEEFNWDEVLAETAQLPEVQAGEIDDKPIVLETPYGELFNEIAAAPQRIESTKPGRRRENRVGFLPSKAQARFSWRNVAFFMAVCFCLTLVVNLWLYAGRQSWLNQVNTTNTRIRQLAGNIVTANKQTKAILGNIDGSKAQIGCVKAELDDSAAELKKVQDELAATRQELANARQGNSDAVKRLTEQIRKLTNQLAELKNSGEAGN